MFDSKYIWSLKNGLEAKDPGVCSYAHLALSQKDLDPNMVDTIIEEYQGEDRAQLLASRIVAVASLDEARLILSVSPKTKDSIPNWSVMSTDSRFWDLFLRYGIGHKLHLPTIVSVDPNFVRDNAKGLKAKKFTRLVCNQSSGFVFSASLYTYSEAARLYLLWACGMTDYPAAFAARMARLDTLVIESMERAYRLYIREQSEEYKHELAEALVTTQTDEVEWPPWLTTLLTE